jgi:hypothetical protein
VFEERDGFDRKSIQCSETEEPEPQTVPQQYVEMTRTGYPQSPRKLYESFHNEERVDEHHLPAHSSTDDEKCDLGLQSSWSTGSWRPAAWRNHKVPNKPLILAGCHQNIVRLGPYGSDYEFKNAFCNGQQHVRSVGNRRTVSNSRN